LIFILLNSSDMSKKKSKKEFGHGGARDGAGRPKGSGEKTKICVSVNKWNWQAASSKWKIASHLVDRLLMDYLSKGGIQGMEAK